MLGKLGMLCLLWLSCWACCGSWPWLTVLLLSTVHAGSGPAIAEANALRKGPVVFHIPQARQLALLYVEIWQF